MRDVIFLIADLECEATLRGFFSRDQFHRSLSCGRFSFDLKEDLLRDTVGKDPGVWKNAHQLLRTKRLTHERAMIILDNAWDGSPDVEAIERDISNNMIASGWPRDRFEVVVIDPELECWIWQDNSHVDEAFGHERPPSLRVRLREASLWPEDQSKPPDPKRAVEMTNSWYRFGAPSAVFNEIASRVSIRGCTDPAFLKMRGALQRWFPQ